MPKASLYRHFDAQDRLLYIGISRAHLVRLTQHQASSPWYWDIAKVTIEHFSTWSEAFVAEKAAITNERPLFNPAPREKGNAQRRAQPRRPAPKSSPHRVPAARKQAPVRDRYLEKMEKLQGLFANITMSDVEEYFKSFDQFSK